MSRALNISQSLAHVTDTCARLALPISTIEKLPSGDTRVVLRNGDASATLARHYAKNLLGDDVARTPLAVRVSGYSMPVTDVSASPTRTRSSFFNRDKD